MAGRRKPLVLASTKQLINSVLSSSQGGEATPGAGDKLFDDGSPRNLQLPVGILRISEDANERPKPQLAALYDSALVGLSTSFLRRLSITSGSLVLVKNVEMNIQGVAQAVALDPPGSDECASDVKLPSPPIMLVFPSCAFPNGGVLGHEVAYISPLLAFNLGLHITCLESILHQGEEVLASYFDPKVNDKATAKRYETSVVDIELEPLVQAPRYASHLRVSFVKIPECGTLETLRGISPMESEDRQNMIDSALQKYFQVDRYLAKGDIFGVRINWNCNSILCIPCNQKAQKKLGNLIYFKVIAMEPSDEPILLVNRVSTALVLVGSIPSALPPDLLIAGPEEPVPLQWDIVKVLASVLTPAFCPSALSLKFRVSVLLYGLAGCGKRTVVRYVARRLGMHVVEYNCHDLTLSEKNTSVALVHAFKTARRYSPTILILRHFEVFRDTQALEGPGNDQRGNTSEIASIIRKFTEPVNKDGGIYSHEKQNGEFGEKSADNTSGHPILLIATAVSSEGLPSTIRRCFSHEIKMGPLTEEQRAEMLSQSLQSVISNTDAESFAKEMVGQTSGFTPRDMRALIADVGANLFSKSFDAADKARPKDIDGSCSSEAMQDNNHLKVPQEVQEVKEHLTKALERSKKRNAATLGAPKVPNVKWEDVGGLEDVKKSILDTVQLPLLHKDLFSSGLRKRSGVLLYGPPGTGKTLLAKAVATECSLNFLSVKGPELINMYIGESEKNVRDIFQKARSSRPCVIFFDELDSLAPARGASGDSGGVMDRVVSQMLAEIDGLNDSAQDLFIIGASNRPDLIDPALLRPGRFDKLLYVGVNSDASYRERVLKALTRKFKLSEDVSLYSIAKKCPPNFTGADMYALCADAWFQAAKRKVLSADPESSGKDDDADSVIVEYSDFVQVLVELTPSLSKAELKRYEQLRDQFEGRSK
ncbi:hypothetical protein QN277_012606 [Acacia crassicarpa]|uniref:Peroxisomal ATPase PEX6 n=1 Tax=Acacia crassicarpa TaxID=499986 RepID=A0AAE1N1D3_9FABA|nr:hypothetical protein QN277_012606 [Acacia crassicarpa]